MFRACAASVSVSVSVPLAVTWASFWEGVGLRDGFPPPIVPSFPGRLGLGLGDGAADCFALSSSLSWDVRLPWSGFGSLRFLPPI